MCILAITHVIITVCKDYRPLSGSFLTQCYYPAYESARAMLPPSAELSELLPEA